MYWSELMEKAIPSFLRPKGNFSFLNSGKDKTKNCTQFKYCVDPKMTDSTLLFLMMASWMTRCQPFGRFEDWWLHLRKEFYRDKKRSSLRQPSTKLKKTQKQCLHLQAPAVPRKRNKRQVREKKNQQVKQNTQSMKYCQWATLRLKVCDHPHKHCRRLVIISIFAKKKFFEDFKFKIEKSAECWLLDSNPNCSEKHWNWKQALQSVTKGFYKSSVESPIQEEQGIDSG